MKRFLAMFLCVALLLSMVLNTGAVFATEAPTIVCEDVTCSPGEQVTVEVTVTKNPGFAYLELTPQYASELTFVKVQNGELVSDFTKGKQYVWVADEDVTEDGLLLTFTFDVAETVPAGEYTVDFVLRNCFNYNEESVQFAVHSGMVKVEQVAPAVPAGITYEIVDGEVTIIGFTEELNGDLEIPETIEGYPVTAIGDEAFWGCRQLTAVTIPDSVRSIGSTAFAQCSWLNSLTLGAGVTGIGGHAFYMCYSLSEVIIPASVTEIGECAFGGEAHEEMSIVFEGNMPTIAETAFYTTESVAYSCYYPADNSTWSADALQNYGDEVTWKGAYTVASGENQEIIHSAEKDFVLRIDGGIEGFQGISIDGVAIDPTCYTINGGLGLVIVSAEYIKTIPGDHGVNLPLDRGTVEAQVTFANYCGENLTWVLDSEGTLTISGTGDMFDYEVSEEGDDYAPWHDEIVNHVVIEDGVCSIGANAFNLCREVQSVSLGNTVEKIGLQAFSQCEGLSSVTIPASVKEIGSGAFRACLALTEMLVEEGNSSYCNDQHGVLYTADMKTLVQAPAKLSGTYSIPAGVETINANAFTKCFDLTGIEIPESVISIGDAAFQFCSGLREVQLPDGLQNIGMLAFGGCTSLAAIVIPDSVTDIALWAFRDCTDMVSVTLGNGVNSIGYGAFYNCASLSAIDISNNVTSIGTGAFEACSMLTSAKIGSGVSEMGSHIFSGCNNLQTVTLAEGLPYIPGGMFSDCRMLTSIVIPDSARRIDYWAFLDCSKLATVTVGSGVTAVDWSAFAGCSNLQTVFFRGNAPEINSEAFLGVTATCYYPADNATWTTDVMQNYGGTLTWAETQDEVADIIASGSVGAGLRWELDSQGVLTISGNGTMEEEEFAFVPAPWSWYKDSVNKVVIENGVENIGGWAFEAFKQLARVVVGDSVTRIGNCAFMDASNLQEIVFAGDAPAVGANAFSEVTATCYYPADNATWTADVMQNYNGNITWLPAGEIVVEKADGTTDTYVSLQAAVDDFESGDQAVMLQSSVKEDITVNTAVTVDLNGFTITGDVTGSGTLTVKDSQTDDFDVEDGNGYGVITGTVGANVVAADGYVKITEADGVSFHKVDLTIKSMGLRPAEAGLYFKSDFAGDQVVARNVDSFGVALSVTGVPDETTLENPLHFTRYEPESFGTGADNTSTLLTGILKEDNGYNTNVRNAKIQVYGRAYIEIDGEYTFGVCRNRNMVEQMEGIDGKWSELSETQKTGILAMYEKYEMVMRGWNLPNLKAEADF